MHRHINDKLRHRRGRCSDEFAHQDVVGRRPLERRVAVFPATNTKTRQVEVACLNEDAVEALRGVPRVGEWVWTRRDGERWRDPRPAFRVACRRAGLADVKGRFHVLRHTAATWMEMAGVLITTIARVTGPRSRAALERYLHDSDRAARAAVEALRISPAPGAPDSTGSDGGS